MPHDPNSLQHRRAVALRYDETQDRAPKLVAKGKGLLAEQIIALAREHQVHVQEDRDLVAALSVLEVNAEIPEALYRAVAEVLAFVYQVNQRMPARGGERAPR